MTNTPTNIQIPHGQPITTALAKNLVENGLGKPRGISHEDTVLYPPAQRELLKHKCKVRVIRSPRTHFEVFCFGCQRSPFGELLRLPLLIKASESYAVALDFAVEHYAAHAKLAQERAVTRGKLGFQ